MPDQFIDRPARFSLNVPLSFKSDDGIEAGNCVNISSSGMLAVFERAVELFTVGEISMVVGEYMVNLKGKVSRVQNGDYGIAFKIETDNDRLTVQLLVEYASANHQPEVTI